MINPVNNTSSLPDRYTFGFAGLLIRRYILPRGNLTTFAMVVAVIGVAIGIAQLMTVLAVMSGFEIVLKNNYTRITSEMVLQGRRVEKTAVAEIREIEAITPFVVSQGLIAAKGKVAGVVLEGIDRESSSRVVDWPAVFQSGPVEVEGDWIWLGTATAKKLGLVSGDHLEIVIASGTKRTSVSATVSAITKFGIYDHDLHWARIDFQFFDRLFGVREPFYKVKLVPGTDPHAVRDAIEKKLKVTTRLWNELNRNIFLAVSHQKKLLFLVLQVVVALAAVNVVNLLVMNTHFRRRDLAILRAMGLHRSGVFWIFVAQGLIIGLCGVLLGVVLGFGVCLGVQYYQPVLLNESVYNVTRLPVVIRLSDVGMLGGVALILCLVFSVFPAWRAMRLLPIEALRSE